MKNRSLLTSCILCTLLLSVLAAAGQGTAFTYQGRLTDTGASANGTYDLRFNLYDALTGGSLIAGPVTNTAVTVSNGLFTVKIDFGTAFPGASRFLEIGARSNTVAVNFTAVAPRQELTPTPYAITSQNLSGFLNANQLTGILPGGLLSGLYGNALNLNNAGNTLSGNGAGLTGLNASALASGTVNDLRLSPNVALLNKNQTFTGVNTFDRGVSGPGRLIVAGDGFVNTAPFTGLGFQYYANGGEGAIMSSYNDGFGYLSFYTKAGSGYPLTKEMIIDRVGNVAIDQGDYNNGFINNGQTNGAGLTFGVGSGEGIASKRTPGGNQWGLDFYTGFQNRMSIINDGFVGIGRQYRIGSNEILGLSSTTTSNWTGMFIQGGNGSRPYAGYSNPGGSSWTEMDGLDGNKWKLYNSGYQVTVTTSGSVGLGTTAPSGDRLDIRGNTRINDNNIFLRAGGDTNHGLGYRSTVYGLFFDGPFLWGYNGGALGTVGPDEVSLTWDYVGNVWISNNCSVATLTIRGGADLAEPFQMTEANTIPQGAVVVIDEENPGQLKLSKEAYDTRVAGVVSGANGVNPGIQMQQQGLIEGGKNVALTGRVYVQADASFGAIKPGDLLTTSDTPGHAMKVANHSKAQGAILGKAMTGLKEGRGKVLVLVTLQ